MVEMGGRVSPPPRVGLETPPLPGSVVVGPSVGRVANCEVVRGGKVNLFPDVVVVRDVVVVPYPGFKQQVPSANTVQAEYCWSLAAGPQQSPPSQSQPQLLFTVLHLPFPTFTMLPLQLGAQVNVVVVRLSRVAEAVVVDVVVVVVVRRVRVRV